MGVNVGGPCVPTVGWPRCLSLDMFIQESDLHVAKMDTSRDHVRRCARCQFNGCGNKPRKQASKVFGHESGLSVSGMVFGLTSDFEQNCTQSQFSQI